MKKIFKKNSKINNKYNENTSEFQNIDINSLYFHLFYNHYNNYQFSIKNGDVEELLNYSDDDLRKFRKYIYDHEDKATSIENDPDRGYMHVKYDQKPTFYRADLVNKIDMIIYLRKKITNKELSIYTNYIRPYAIQDVYNVITSYLICVDGNFLTEWVDEENMNDFIKNLDSRILFVLEAYIEMIQKMVTKKYHGEVDWDWRRNHYTEEDQITYNLTDLALKHIQDVKLNDKTRRI